MAYKAKVYTAVQSGLDATTELDGGINATIIGIAVSGTGTWGIDIRLISGAAGRIERRAIASNDTQLVMFDVPMVTLAANLNNMRIDVTAGASGHALILYNDSTEDGLSQR